MIRYKLIFVCLLCLWSCKENKSGKPQGVKTSQIKQEYKDTIAKNESLKPIESKKDSLPIPALKLECADNQELNYYRKYGKVHSSHKDFFSCSYENESIIVRVSFKNCMVSNREIKSKINKAYSFAHYSGIKQHLVTYDSIDANGENIIDYNGRPDHMNRLPLYLRVVEQARK